VTGQIVPIMYLIYTTVASSLILQLLAIVVFQKEVTFSQFHQRYTHAFFVQIFQQSQNVTRKMTFVQNFCTYNVDEIDTFSSFDSQKIQYCPRTLTWTQK